MTEYEQHPVGQICRHYNKEEAEALVESMQTHGFMYQHPVTMYEGMVLDGWHRYQVALHLGLDPIFVEYDEDDPAGFVLSENMVRRHLTPAERVLLAQEGKKLAEQGTNQYRGLDPGSDPLESEEPGVIPGTTLPDPEELPEPVVTRQEVAKAAGVSVGTVDRVNTVLNSGNEEVIEKMKAGEIGVKAAAQEVKSPTLNPLHNTTGNQEWYTPDDVIEAVRFVLGTIELDPASSEIANEVVQAQKIFTLDDDGLAHEWEGAVFMNPPYSARVIDQFVTKLLSSPKVTQAITLTNICTETSWGHALLRAADYICFPSRRFGFRKPDGTTPGLAGQGSMICGIGVDKDRFYEAFGGVGIILT